MKVLRFVFALTLMLFVWFVVFAGVGWAIAVVFHPSNGAHFLLFWLDWHALPGLLLGLVMGVRAFLAITRDKKPPPPSTPPPAAQPSTLNSQTEGRGDEE